MKPTMTNFDSIATITSSGSSSGSGSGISSGSTPNPNSNNSTNDSVEDLMTLLLQPPRTSAAAIISSSGSRIRQESYQDRAVRVLGSAQNNGVHDNNTCSNDREGSRRSHNHNSLLSILDEALLILDRHQEEERQEQKSEQ